MKKIFFIMVTLLVTTTMVMAQGKGPKDGKQEKVDPKVRAERVTERMTKDLSLTDKQKQQVLELNLASFTQKAENKPMPKPKVEGEAPAKLTKEQREEMRSEREAERTAYDAKLKFILTPEQYTKYTELQAKRKDADKKGPKDGKKNKGGDRPTRK